MARGNLHEEVAKRVVDELVEELKNETREHVKKLFYTGSSTYRPKENLKGVRRGNQRSVELSYSASTYDKKKFKLGFLCNEEHEYQKTGQSLRYKISGRCAMCQSIYNKYRRAKVNATAAAQEEETVREANARVALEKKYEVNRKLHTLGALCAYGHNHGGTGYSLRYKSTGRCVGCNRDYAQQYWKDKKKASKAKK